MQIFNEIGYGLYDEKQNFIIRKEITVSQLIRFAEQSLGGIPLFSHVYSENEIRLYDRELSDKKKHLLFYILGVPRKKGCCF